MSKKRFSLNGEALNQTPAVPVPILAEQVKFTEEERVVIGLLVQKLASMRQEFAQTLAEFEFRKTSMMLAIQETDKELVSKVKEISRNYGVDLDLTVDRWNLDTTTMVLTKLPPC